MLKSYRIEDGDLCELEGDLGHAALRKSQWIDLCDASPEEKDRVEAALNRRLLQGSPRLHNRQLEHVLTNLGPSREILVKLRRSILSSRRMIAFLGDQDAPKSLLAKLETFERDLISA